LFSRAVLIPAPHGDHHIGRLDRVCGELLRELLGDVQADLGHGLADRGVDLIGWGGSGGAHAHGTGAVVVQQPGGHLGAAGVVHTDEQHLGNRGHRCSRIG
jgi:hypothetical protein